MSLLDTHLAPGESIQFRARHHWLINLRSFGTRNWFEPIVVTNRRVLKKTGILAIDIQSLPFENLEARDLKQSLIGRLFGFGDVVLYGTGGQSEYFSGLNRPVQFLKEIDKAIVERRKHP